MTTTVLYLDCQDEVAPLYFLFISLDWISSICLTDCRSWLTDIPSSTVRRRKRWRSSNQQVWSKSDVSFPTCNTKEYCKHIEQVVRE